MRSFLRGRGGRALLVTVVTFLVGYTISARWLFPSAEDPTDDRFTEIPDLVGMELGAATARVTELGFAPAHGTSLHHPDVAEGRVVAQSPLSGQVARAGDTVRLVLSAGPESRVVPELSGLAGDEAAALLRNLGFEVDIERSRGSAPGVLESRPAAGTRVAMPGSVVLVVSSGSSIVAVPDLRGRHIDDVESLLVDAQLRLGAIRYQVDAPEGPGRVVSQSPVPGSSLRGDGLVSIVVAGEPPDSVNADVTDEGVARRDSSRSPGGAP